MKKVLSTLTALLALGAPALAENTSTTTPTVLLVHGAFADASSWSRVIEELHKAGIEAQAVANPLRGLQSDGDYVASLAQQIPGPVLLVGHSYGGPVITVAGSEADNVKGLVYVASFGLDRGQSIQDTLAGFKEPPLNSALQPLSYPNGAATATEFLIQKDRFHEVFSADLPHNVTDVLRVSQRPVAASAFGEKLQVEPAWKKLPSWFLVATADQAINPDAQRAAAQRIHATTIEVEASHAVAVSRPAEVTGLILQALKSLQP
ncbi:alpha/beta fold hydrolase [Deinococcus cellulosilyticus]|uniref:Alpha/beta hydrolase n=1 Tax=Deinococcus cellulosilyticus (strain DSM 18568 / NBRC 106333 / KACC 11606 / 5516J-15) TaxID=1223518 RepID=A0A511N0F2_DEIC1|nr:alpha/beta hydrolase [Deinococcus cellulosilyticus]GEM46332.1 alpha/beta hydrolase [Deinococcus cellulosilyticus NBRC 106333 = KACC 11606]